MPDAVVATITVLFTDLVDSTGLLRHGPEAADDLRRRHLTTVVDAVERQRGTVVKSLGDGVMATFSSASDAVRAAVAVQQGVHLLQRGDTRSPPVRVGLATGEASAEGGDWFGSPVIESARLCAEAGGGQILASGVVGTLVGSRGDHRFTPLEPRTLKGFDAPVAVSTVEWEPLPAIVLPPPVESALASAAPFVGRSAELDTVWQAWKDAAAGTRAVALVAGEPGVGKTRLLAELAQRARADGATVLWGRCDEDPVLPYQPFVEQVRHWLASDPSAALPGDLERLLPETTTASSATIDATVDGEAERLRLFEATAALYRRFAADGPLLVVLDDLHWAATPTLLMMRHVMAATAGERVMVVGAYRDTELDRKHPFAGVLADLRREEGVVRVSLDGIDTSSVVEFLERVAGQTLDDDGIELARLVQAETKGNPFFIGQILRHLTETGALTSTGGQWSVAGPVAELGLPEGVREVVGRRLSRLSDAANDTLLIAAVVGAEFDLATIEAVATKDHDVDQVLDAMDECVAARLIHEVPDSAGRYGFVHALVRQTLLTELTAARRTRLHRRIGEALVARGGVEPAALANHFCAGAAAGAVVEALEWSIAAADASLLSWAPEEAMTIVERALHAADLSNERHPGERATLLLQKTGALQLLGDTTGGKDAAAEAAAEARIAGDVTTFALAATSRAGWPLVGVPDLLASELLNEALDLLGDEDLAMRARVLGVLAFYRAHSEGAGIAVLPMMEEATRLAREVGDPEALVQCLLGELAMYIAHPDLERQRVLHEEIAAIAMLMPGDRGQFISLHFLERQLVLTSIQSGDIDAAKRASAAVQVLGHEHNQVTGFTPMWDGVFALMEGRIDDAEEANTRLAGYANDVNFANSWAAQLFQLRREQGRVAELLPVLDGLVASTPGLVAMRTVYALALADVGELDRAKAILDDLTGDGLATVPTDATWSSSLANLTEVAAALGDVNAAASLREHLVPFSGQLLVIAWGVACIGAADRYLAMLDSVLGNHDLAATEFAAALALEQAAGATALAARTRQWQERLSPTTS